jgi:hypothetical protein
MNTNSVLEETWAVKDRLAAEAGGDLRVFCEQLRAWEQDHLPPGFKLRSPEELRSVQESAAELLLREEPPEK